MLQLTNQQSDIINAPLTHLAVIACAGSGKTRTAVQRLINIATNIAEERSKVALLSFSNIAVQTFKKSLINNTLPNSNFNVTNSVVIDTFDGFITNYLIRAHGHRTMGCSCIPFLITGAEQFLNNNKYKGWYRSGQKDIPISGKKLHDISIDFDDNSKEVWAYETRGLVHILNNGMRLVESLAKTGGYTHEFGRYWALRTLIEQERITQILAKKFPYIIVDEAQDIGILHQCILELLIEQGVQVTLVGDPNQAIFEFAKADGQFLKSFKNQYDARAYSLSTNFRSIPQILNVANYLSSRQDVPDPKYRGRLENKNHGTFYISYDPKKPREAIESFLSKVDSANLDLNNSAVLCRSRLLIEKINTRSNSPGQGKTWLLAQAAIFRDAKKDYYKAFELTLSCIVSLLDGTPDNLYSLVAASNNSKDYRLFKRLVWQFVRSTEKGLPSTKLIASKEWHPKLKVQIVNLIQKIEEMYQYKPVGNIGSKISKRGLLELPLFDWQSYETKHVVNVRTDTVHQAKGESLDAVLYLANKNQIDEMLKGPNSELGRIGYVALTRARKLFILGVPRSSTNSISLELESAGLSKI